MEVMQQTYNEQCRENERLQKEKNCEKDVKIDKMESEIELLRMELQKEKADE